MILERRYGVTPLTVSHAPDLDAMLRIADAALIIGDPALRIDPAALPWHVYDLGAEWVEMTGLPMVFAVWAGRKGMVTPELVAAFQESCRYGLSAPGGDCGHRVGGARLCARAWCASI